MRPGEEMMKECLPDVQFKQWCKLMDEHAAINDRITTIKEQLGEEQRLQDHVMSRIKKFWDFVRRPQNATCSVSTPESVAKHGVYISADTTGSVSNLEAAIEMIGAINKNRPREQ